MKVKAGDLAYLVKSTKGKNVGRICEVKEFIGTYHYPDVVLHELWRVEFLQPIEVELLGSDGRMHVHFCKIALACESWLKPISGIPLNDEVDTTKEIENV